VLLLQPCVRFLQLFHSFASVVQRVELLENFVAAGNLMLEMYIPFNATKH